MAAGEGRDVVVVGAGMAGLTAARRLAAAGHRVQVVDKGRGVGGRMATRRLGGAGEGAVADHGAQFFTARDPGFADDVDGWVAGGAAREWCRGFRTPPDGHPRYVGVGGMTAVPKLLAAPLAVAVAARVTAVAPVAGRWRVAGPAEPVVADAVVLTAPVPQSLALLDAGGVTLDPRPLAALRAVAYSPTLAAVVVLDDPGVVPAPGGVQLDDGPLTWVGDNRAKGISPRPCLTLHASPGVSSSLWDAPAEEALAAMLAPGAGAAWIGGAAVLDAQLARWRYAQPTSSHDDRCLVAVDGPSPVVCAGDAFGEAKVEGAARSGWAAAGAVLDRLG